MPYLKQSTYDELKSKASRYTDMTENYGKLKTSHLSQKEEISELSQKLKTLKKSVDNTKKTAKRYSKMYVGMRERYQSTTERLSRYQGYLSERTKKIAELSAQLQSSRAAYNRAMVSNSTNITRLNVMKLQYESTARKLNAEVKAAKVEAKELQEKVESLEREMREIEKNEETARERSLTNALVQTRDVAFNQVFPNLSGMSENQSKGLAAAAGVVVFLYMVGRIE